MKGSCWIVLAKIVTLSLAVAACGPASTPVPTATPVPPTAKPTRTPTPVPPTATSTHTPTPVPPTATPTHTPTPVPPTATPTRTPTETPSSTSRCNVDQMLAKLRPVITLGEFELVYNITTGFSTLIVWFVDPDLDPGASGDEIAQNAGLAMRHAAEISHQLHVADPCVLELSAAINPVVVDREYNGWFAGLITPSSLPGDTKLTDTQLAELTGAFEISYLRDRPAPPMEPAPGGSCSWPEARSGIQWHWEVSGPAPSNIGAFLSIDESGVTVTAQWPGVSGEWAEYAVPTFMAGTINVAMELHCLHPRPDLLVLLVVDDAGKVEIVGVWSGEAMRAEDLSQLRYRQLEN